MQYWLIQGPDGTHYQVYAASAEAAIGRARQALSGQGFGATDLTQVVALGPIGVNAAANIPQLGTTSPSAGGSQPPFPGNTRGQVDPVLQRMLGTAAFREGLRQRGQAPEGLLGGFYAEQQPEYEAGNVFSGYLRNDLDVMNQPELGGLGTFTGAARGNIYDTARDLFNRVGTFIPTSDQGVVNYNALFSGDPTEQDKNIRALRNHLANLAGAAGTSKYGVGLTSILGPSQERVGRRIQDIEYANAANKRAGEGGFTNYYDAYRRAYGL